MKNIFKVAAFYRGTGVGFFASRNGARSVDDRNHYDYYIHTILFHLICYGVQFANQSVDYLN